MSSVHNRAVKCVADEGGIFENLLLEHLGVNNGNFMKSDALKSDEVIFLLFCYTCFQ